MCYGALKVPVNLTRLDDGMERLHALIDSARHRQFEWGIFDCFTFAADAVEAITGVDPMAELRGTYDDQRSATELLIKHGGVETAVSDILGRRAGTAEYAQRGDIVLMGQSPVTMRLGVVYSGFAMGPRTNGDGFAGLARTSFAYTAKAWLIR